MNERSSSRNNSEKRSSSPQPPPIMSGLSAAMFAVAALLLVVAATLPHTTTVLGQEQGDRVVVHVKSGDPKDYDEVHAASMAMNLATNLQNAGMNVTVYLDVNGVHLAVQQPSFIHSQANSMLRDLITNGATVIVCPHCLVEAGYSPEQLVEGAQLASPEEATMANVLRGNVTVIDY
jgi:sulfur relay (sulfurtransferase) complex TusBCD TusD component (DsrE family)